MALSKIIKSEGIVFRSLNYSETSLILDIYTLKYGLDSYIVGGVRKSRSKMANVYHPVNIIDIVAYRNENGLSRISEAQYSYSYKDLYRHVVKSSLGMFFIDLARNAIKEKEANAETYNFLKEYLINIDEGNIPLKHAAIRFPIDLAAYLGFQIHNNYSAHKPWFDLSSGSFTERMASAEYALDEKLSEILAIYLTRNEDDSIERETRNAILDKLILFYQLHVEGFKKPKSLEVIRTILS